MSAALRELKKAFAEAVHDLAAEPTSENVLRYLVASRALERRVEAVVPEPQAVAA
jgi:RNase P/RNase MRP subunit p30